MISQQPRQTVALLAVMDGLLLGLAFTAAFAVRAFAPLPALPPGYAISVPEHFWMLTVSLPLFWFLGAWTGHYDLSPLRSRASRIGAAAKSFAGLSALLAAAIFLFQAKSFSRAIFFLFVGLGFVFVVGTRLLLEAFHARGARRADTRRVLIVGAGPDAIEVVRRIEDHPELGMRVAGHLLGPGETEATPGLAMLGSLDDLRRIVEDQVVDDVVFALPFDRTVACGREIGWCEEVGVPVHLRADFIRTLFARTYPTELDGMPMLTISPTPRDPLSLLVKRGLDLAVAGAALACASPLLLVAAAAVKLTSAGPVLFRQERVGLNGRTFTLLKFRSMYRDAEARRSEVAALNEMSGPVFKARHDPRVTPVGRWLRRFSVDELPQLWNVLRGDMSLVGPRPPLPDEVRRYERWQRRRLSMKPGITCLWQVSGRNQIGFEEWMRLDLAYIDNWSLKLDLEILLRTVPAVVTARGAN